MSSVLSRIVELVGWIALGISALLLIAAHHIDNYQAPEPVTALQSK
ncbi:division septum protein Blr [Trabulsiella odontotermitis]|nr:division septum protein Blr [Trabulsiella odontotermitis]